MTVFIIPIFGQVSMISQPYEVIGFVLQDIKTVVLEHLASDWSLANAGKLVIGIRKAFKITGLNFGGG